eukprot:CAMPEP_0198335282 /NCGR_PEP_ID=MMETSP1450-20131203/20214_1 /TAXON_ID=753684 ORGANISM="Madagascaria erythrocladiodes, Strain CCMP3234" /NCGR_SAMPLE_ID=MMETSP1450 /ASSEMBLY_ACC=CAM_ASM_001115 /LENGTH=158 /DNA_ID=CAMNT_0044039937 /DNA_START=32 /DNA_END=508 /DNA_ORIENTATION=-
MSNHALRFAALRLTRCAHSTARPPLPAPTPTQRDRPHYITLPTVFAAPAEQPLLRLPVVELGVAESGGDDRERLSGLWMGRVGALWRKEGPEIGVMYPEETVVGVQAERWTGGQVRRMRKEREERRKVAERKLQLRRKEHPRPVRKKKNRVSFEDELE